MKIIKALFKFLLKITVAKSPGTKNDCSSDMEGKYNAWINWWSVLFGGGLGSCKSGVKTRWSCSPWAGVSVKFYPTDKDKAGAGTCRERRPNKKHW